MSLLGTHADFSQTDPRWRDKLLGFSTFQTIGRYGCYPTAYANIAQAQGHDVDVAQVNELLKQNNLFTFDDAKPIPQRSDISRNDALSIIYPDIKYVETKEWSTALAPINYFDIKHDVHTDIVVKLDYHPKTAGVQPHFCRVIGINDAKTDVMVVDSYTGQRIWLSSLGRPAGEIIYKAVKFTGNGSGVPQYSPKPVSVPTTVGIRVNQGQWSVRTSPSIRDDNLRAGVVLGGQLYGAEIVDGWAKILFRGQVGYIGPKAFNRI